MCLVYSTSVCSVKTCSRLDFNKQLKARRAYQTGADGYVWSGANKWNHADTDAFGRLPVWEQHEVTRANVVAHEKAWLQAD